MGRHRKTGKKPPRRGTKLNPFRVGEVVQHRRDKVKCKVLEVMKQQAGNAHMQNPVLYRVERPDGSDSHWYTLREIEAMP